MKPIAELKDFKVPPNVIKAMDKMKKEGIFDIDLEKAVMLANVQGNVLNLKS